MSWVLTSRSDPARKYVRFAVGGGYEMPGGEWLPVDNWRRDDLLSCDGIFTIAKHEMRKGRFSRRDQKAIADVCAWFNDHIPVPPWKRSKAEKIWTPEWICWWRLGEKEPVRRLCPLVRILRAYGMSVITLYASRLSNIRYRDRYQVVAEIPAEMRL